MDTNAALVALSALAAEHRLQAFRQLVQAGEVGMAVGELRAALAIPPATLSAHLNVLRQAGLVRDQREGRVIRVFADYRQMNALLAFLTANCCGGVPCEITNEPSAVPGGPLHGLEGRAPARLLLPQLCNCPGLESSAAGAAPPKAALEPGYP